VNIFDLTGKIAIVTGGATGIGFGIAKGLAAAGATVSIANRRVEMGQKAVESLRSEGLNALAVPTDVSDKASVAALISKIISDFDRIDILVNNAAVVKRSPAEEVSEEDWDYMLDINLKALFSCCQLVGREMIKQRQGKIINISSVIAQLVQPVRSVYAVSKVGVSHLTRALAFEWAKYNININAIAPGLTPTEFSNKYYKENPEVLGGFLKEVPIGRVACPEDYVGAAIFFASDASNYVTGQVLFVDGGMTIHQ